MAASAIEGIPKEHIDIVQALYLNSVCRVGADGELSSELTMSSSAHQVYPFSPYLSNFVIGILLWTAPSPDFAGISLPGNLSVDLDYADDAVLVCEDAPKIVF